MKGSILFNKDINIEVDVDPSAEEGARLVSAKNLVDGQEAGGGGGGVAIVTIVNNSGDIIEGGFSFINEDPDSPFDGMIVASNTIDTGTYKCPITLAGNIITTIFNIDNITVEGNAEVTSDGIVGIIVKGNCTITFSAE